LTLPHRLVLKLAVETWPLKVYMLKISILKVSRCNSKVPVVYSDRSGLIFYLIPANYIQWRLVMALGQHSTQKLRELAFHFDTVYSGTKEKPPM